ncbi:MAG: hypothetical protein ACOCVN_02085 [bacterium]
MHKLINITIVLAVTLVNLVPVVGQRTTSSPYSRYGIGDITHKGFGRSRAMGHIAFGLRDAYHINYLNPASYSSRDSMSFLFDFGASGSTTILQSEEGKNVLSSANIDHLALSFPVAKWIGFSAGLVPFSAMGYDIQENEVLASESVQSRYNGSGQLNQFFLGTSFKFFDQVSIGVNASYLFGSFNQTTTKEFVDIGSKAYTSEINTNLFIRGFYYDIGVQYFKEILDKTKLTVGFVYDPKVDLNSTSTKNKYIRYPFTATRIDTVESVTEDLSTPFASNFGGGFTINLKERIIFGVDYGFQNWESVAQGDSLVNASQLSAGIEFIPNPDALKGYLNRVRYRLGGYYNNTYIKIGDDQLNEYGLTLGFGLPLRNSKSSMNISFEAGQRGALHNNLLKETYFIWTLNLTLFDYWFFKPKID